MRSYRLNNAKDLDPLIERIGDAQFVLLGEASHGTHEYYTWRTAISKRLIAEKNFRFIAVEGDWPDCYRINHYVKGYSQEKSVTGVLRNFQRWPTWMWANWEVAALVEWMRSWNSSRLPNQRAGFYGLDVYSLWESLETLIAYLGKHDPGTANIARRALNCLERNGRDEQAYAVHALSNPCKDETVQLLREIRKKAFSYNEDPEATLNTSQNAAIAVEAERYYRSMLALNDQSWNIRDMHMAETLRRLIDYHGPNTKAIVWEHNTHIGDARFTDMSKDGLLNVGQLIREFYGTKRTVLVGFGSYQGKVIAGRGWGDPMEEMTVPAARKGSVEDKLHAESPENRLLVFDRMTDKDLPGIFPHRAIGVVYHPENERHNYVPSVVSSRYDAFVYLDKTTAVHPLHVQVDTHQVPETYPFEV